VGGAFVADCAVRAEVVADDVDAVSDVPPDAQAVSTTISVAASEPEMAWRKALDFQRSDARMGTTPRSD
jgi:hypothetical protein